MYFFQVRASAVFALGTLLDVGFDSSKESVGGDKECDDDEKLSAEISIIKSLLTVVQDGSPLVRAEVCVGTYLLAYKSFYCLLLLLSGFSYLLHLYTKWDKYSH